MRPADLTPNEVLAQRHEHGTRVRYMTGCCCVPCRAANSRYETERALARKNGDWNGLVSAERARIHLRRLSKVGVGRRSVAAASDVAESILHEVSIGKRKTIRARTERRILAVTQNAFGDKTLVSAHPTWKRIEWLLSEGLTKREVSRRLGYRRYFQFNRDRVTARTAAKVERLVRIMHIGEGRRGRRRAA